ncbi:MAG: PEP-CTERM/exosortase system-associated acyltransferase [Gammaproteobacteria bacterium]|nr:MAG: PEP-CTERM/exosortase system-associated acyltransferase [Gammaproteobacteria bacterium]
MFDFSESLLLVEDSQNGGGADDVVSILQRFRSLNSQLGATSGSFTELSTRARSKLIDAFEQHFAVQVVQTPEQMRELMRMRYAVYCEEFKYECAEEFPHQLEVDEFDAQAIHCLILHRSTKRSAGCVRIVASQGQSVLPVERYCSSALFSSHRAAIPKNREVVNEVSRLAVAPEFRRFSPGTKASKRFSKAERACLPLIACACYVAALVLSRMCGRNQSYAVMEPFLPRLLRRSGVHFERAGEDLEYHGIRAPYTADGDAVLNAISPDLRQWCNRMYKDFCCTLNTDAVEAVQGFCENQFSLLTDARKQTMLDVG